MNSVLIGSSDTSVGVSIQLLLFERPATESYPMHQWPSLGCDRYGHQTSVGGVSSKTISFEASHSAQPDESAEPPAHDLMIQNAAARSPIQRILIPIDAAHVKPVDLKPILKVAQHFGAEVTLLHCYEIPLSFHYAVGRSALIDVILHREMVRMRLLKLCAGVLEFFARCRSEFALGSLPVEILCASRRLKTDLIVVPLSVDFVSQGWTTKQLLDELVRKANCSVLGIPSAQKQGVDRFNLAS
jgi:hypothetical protein